MKKLEENRYHVVSRLLEQVTINQLFARSVVERKIDGSVYVDRTDEPQAAYVLHAYGMALLFGDSGQTDFADRVWEYLEDRGKQRRSDEWLQVFPDAWADKVEANCPSLERHRRVNFKFSPAAYAASRGTRRPLPEGMKVVRTDKLKDISISGTVVPGYFWRNPEDFSRNGVGCSVVIGDDIVSTAFSAFIIGDQLEIGIETDARHRGNGYAEWACSALIEYCLKNDLEPVWACRMENRASFRLAGKLGFEATAILPYYRFQPNK